MIDYYEAGNPDIVGYPMSDDEEWWAYIDQDEEWILEQERISLELESQIEEY